MMGHRTVAWCDHCGKPGTLRTLRYGKTSDWSVGSGHPESYKEAVLCPGCLTSAFKKLNKRAGEAKSPEEDA